MKKGASLFLILAATLAAAVFSAGCAGRDKTPPPAALAARDPGPAMALDDPAVMFGKPLACNVLDVQAFSYVAKRPKHKKKAAPASAATGAWGDVLDKNLKCIAVSPDLLGHGLTRNTKVKIQGLEGDYLVLDTMSERWTKSIDIYQGADLGAALQWGSRGVRISWEQNRGR
ncbi:MAG: hypothetical protein HQK81_09675 [Desulfovibrionaceae bacterium]|nr:hypothetical protein [Desulfovibrionaceae bacterium]MBF0514308.1 hypothetical protein [Desulfovibrionaceae bacterium]